MTTPARRLFYYQDRVPLWSPDGLMNRLANPAGHVRGPEGDCRDEDQTHGQAVVDDPARRA